MSCFDQLDSNDTWGTHCMSLVSSEKYKLRKNHTLLDMYTADIDYVFECQLEERKLKCQFCKKRFDCRRFCQLCHEWDGIVTNSQRKKNIYCTAIRFCQRNLPYPKTECMTLDFLNSGVVDEEFMNFVESKEKVLFKTANEFRKVKLW